MAEPQPPVVRSTKFGTLPAAMRNPSASPWIAVPFFRHWYVSAVPLAPTEKLAPPPAQTVSDEGCDAIAVAAFTVSVAALEASAPHAPVTRTS